MDDLAPVLLFVYDRPEHTTRTLEALRRNTLAEKSDLYIFSDAPRSEEAQKSVLQVRERIKKECGFKNITIVEREKNLGLANSIIDGVTSICRQYGRVIVLEDDIVTSKYFLEFMNNSLLRYEGVPNVMQISGYMFPLKVNAQTDCVFLPFISSWGWGTWASAWESFDATGSGYNLLIKDRKLRRAFNLNGSYPYFPMLQSQRSGKTNSWAILWYLSVFLKNGLALYPVRTLAANIGFDGTGVNCGISEVKDRLDEEFRVHNYPSASIDPEILRKVFSYLVKNNPSALKRLTDKILGFLQ